MIAFQQFWIFPTVSWLLTMNPGLYTTGSMVSFAGATTVGKVARAEGTWHTGIALRRGFNIHGTDDYCVGDRDDPVLSGEE